MASTESRAPKYIEGYLDKREKGKLLSLERKRFTGIESGFGSLKAGHGWSNYWTVVRGSVMYFFRDGNTHIKENLLGFLNLGPLTSCEKGKSKKSKNTEWHEFELKTDDGKKYQFRASSEIHREQWVYVIHQAVKQMPPGPLPGEPGFDAAVATAPPPPPAVGAELSDDVINNLVRKQGRGLSFNTHIRKISREQEEYESQTAPQGNKDQSPIYDDFPKEQWFMGKMLRTDAENLLERQPTGTYIVRESETDTRPGSYTISVRHSARVKHHRIETNENGKLVIKGHEHRTFNDLATLVEFFVRTQKDVKMVPYTPKPEYQDESYMPMNEPLKEEEYTVMGQGGEVGDDQYTPMVCGLRTGGDGCESQKRNNEEDTRYLPQQVAQMKLSEKVGSKFEDHTYVNIEYLKQVSGYKPQNSGYKPQESKVDMYENLPSKNEEPNPPPIPRREPTDSSNKPSHAYCNYPSPQERQEGPPLPPRRGKSLMQLHGYENMPSKPGASVRRWDSAKLAEPPPRRRPPCQRSVTLQHSDFQAMSTRAPSLMPRAKYY